MLCLLALCTNAQDAASDFKAINAAYKGYSAMALSVQYDVFDSWEATAPLQSERAQIMR